MAKLKTAPDVHTDTLLFSDTDLDLISELLRVASVSLHETITTLERRNPGARFIEVLRLSAEQAADIRERIESR